MTTVCMGSLLGGGPHDRPRTSPAPKWSLPSRRGFHNPHTAGSAAGVDSLGCGLEIGEHEEDAAIVVLVRREGELREDRGDVLLHRPLGDHQPLGDGLVGAPLRDELEHFALTRRHAGKRAVLAGGQKRRDDLGVQGRAAGGDAPERADEVLDVADAVLEQVAEPRRALGEHAHRGSQVDVLREDHDAGPRVPRADLVRGAHALVGVVRGHADVHDRDVGTMALDVPQETLRAARLRDHVDPGAAQEEFDACAGEQAVVRDHDPHGSSAMTTVPVPGGLTTRRLPCSASTRSASPRSPEPPASSAPPTPSSATSILATGPVRQTRIVTLVASAYFATLANASEATK